MDTDYGAPRWVWIVIAAVVVVALVVMFGLPGWRYLRARRILASGVEAWARVISVEDTGNRFNRNPEVRMKIEVRPETGPPFDAETTAVISMVDLSRFNPGSLVKVRYDPANPALVVLQSP